jgi:mono/diheme cytochrome c family protein
MIANLQRLSALAATTIVATISFTEQSQSATDEAISRGKYLFAAAGCAGCHTDLANKGPLLAGGRPLKTPFGTFYSPNITPDTETGIGAWSDADFVRALRHGRSPDGSHYFPAFPYPSYSGMRDADMLDLKAYISSLPPVRLANRPHDVGPPFGWRVLVGVWKWLYFEPGPRPPEAARDVAWNRGAYLVEVLGHCGECHTPRDFMGGRKGAMAYAGTASGPEGGRVPNITPDVDTGIGRWSASDLDSLLEYGMLPDGDFVDSEMAEVVENSTGKLTKADRQAIIDYLMSLTPIRHAITAPAPVTGQ